MLIYARFRVYWNKHLKCRTSNKEMVQHFIDENLSRIIDEALELKSFSSFLLI